MEMILSPNHPVNCIVTGPSECGKSVRLTNLILNNINDHDKIYISSPSLHQDFLQKLLKCSGNFMPIHVITNLINEELIDLVIEEIIINKKSYNLDT